MKIQIIRFAGVVTLLLAMTSCAPPKNNFVGTWSGDSGRAVIDKATATFYDPRGVLQGTWPVTLIDDRDARFDSPLGSGTLVLDGGDTLQAKSGDRVQTYHRV